MPTDLTDLAPDDARLAQHTATQRAHVVARAVAGRRRYHHWTAVLAAAVVAVLAIGTTAVLREQPMNDVAVSARSAYLSDGAFSVGRTVFIGTHRVRFTESVKSLYYTSAGVVVRTGRSASVDEPGPSHYTLVSPVGRRRPLGVTLTDQIPGTSPGSPLIAFAETNGNDRWLLTLMDVRTGTEVHTTVAGAYTWAGWRAPPVSTDGDRVWVLLDQGWVEWNARTGAVRPIPRGERAGTPLAAGGGRYVQERPGRVDVRDFSDGRIVFGHSVDDTATVTLDHLSPDGRVVRYGESFAEYNEKNVLVSPPHGGILEDVDHPRQFALAPGPWGWTPNGQALKVDVAKDAVTVCSVVSQSCRTRSESLPSGALRLGGTQYGK